MMSKRNIFNPPWISKYQNKMYTNKVQALDHEETNSAQSTNTNALKKHGKDVFEQVKSFGRSTSIKGIPRIVTSDRMYIKLIWFGAVCCFLTFAVLQTKSLYDVYRQNQILVITKEHAWYDKAILKERDDPPAFTICDAHASGYPQQPHDLDIESLDQWYERFEQMYENAMNEGNASYELEFSRLLGTGYLETIGVVKKHVFSKLREDFIVHCTLQLAPGSDTNDYLSCDDWVELVSISTPRYPTCYTGYFDNSLILDFIEQYDTVIIGFKLVIYTGDLEETINFGWSDVNQIMSDKNGVLFSLHNAREMVPLMYMDLLAPGYVHDIKTNSYLRQRINHKGSCKDERWASYLDVNNREPLRYTDTMCLAVCVIERVLDQCGCLKLDAIVTVTELSNDTLYCGHLGDNITESMARLDCAVAVSQSSTLECYEPCPVPCSQVIHSYTHSFAKWPTRHQKLDFYEHFIRNRSYEDRFEFYNEVNETGRRNISLALEMLQEDTLIEDNFLQISILSAQTAVLKLEDVYQMSLISFIGQLGGVLNLYAGLTVVVLVEMLEFLIRLVVHPCVSNMYARCKGATRTQTGVGHT